jgi:hypothetical protein
MVARHLAGNPGAGKMPGYSAVISTYLPDGGETVRAFSKEANKK